MEQTDGRTYRRIAALFDSLPAVGRVWEDLRQWVAGDRQAALWVTGIKNESSDRRTMADVALGERQMSPTHAQ